MQLTGAQAMLRCLELEGVPLLFGYPGATIAPFYDALRDSPLRHILTRTEQAAGHAANGWARMHGKPGVCVTTSGPGATNLFTAIATAYCDSIPLVAITGQVNTHQLGHDVFQEVDTTGAVEPFTKYSYLIKSAGEIPRAFKEAFHIASTGRPGPVVIDMPMDVQLERFDFSYPDSVNIRGYKPRKDGHPLQLRRVAEAIRASKRPLLCCGGGIFLSGGQKTVRRLCEEFSIPLVSTLMGVSALPPEHPLYFGMLGQAGFEAANTALRESDLLVLVGARVGDRAISRPAHLEGQTQVVHIDIDTAEIGKNLGTTIPLVGDAARVLEQLIELRPGGDWSEWLGRLGALRNQEAAGTSARPEKPGMVDPNTFIRTLCKHLPDDVIYVADVGQNQLWSARNFAGDGRFLTTGGMGTMGYSIPAAIGAKLARPGQTVLAVCGDGAFQMAMAELATLRQHGIPIKIVVMRNDCLGLIREIQEVSYGGRTCAVDLAGGPDIGQIAAAYGIPHLRVDATADCEAAVQRLLLDEEAFVLECVVDPKEASI